MLNCLPAFLLSRNSRRNADQLVHDGGDPHVNFVSHFAEYGLELVGHVGVKLLLPVVVGPDCVAQVCE
jgi:hypothetical protein